MPELELVEHPKPDETRPSLLKRMFRPKDIGFYLMIALAWIGSIYTTYNPDGSRWYWYWLIPILGVVCILIQWSNVEPTLKARSLLILRQVLHWGAVLGMMLLLYLLAGQSNTLNLIDNRQSSFLMTYTIALSTFLAGINHDWRLCVVALFILTGGIINVAFSNLAPLLVWIGLGVVIVYFVGDWLYNRWRDRNPSPSVN